MKKQSKKFDFFVKIIKKHVNSEQISTSKTFKKARKNK